METQHVAPARTTPRDDDAGLYVISVAAELVGVHPQTLRMYERKGLLDPARTFGGSRRYSERDLSRVRQIAELTAEGVNLEGVRRILELRGEVAALQAELERTRAEAAEAVARVHRHYRRDLVPYRAVPVPLRGPARPGADPGIDGSGGARPARRAS